MTLPPNPPKTIILLIDIQTGFLPAHHPPSFWGPSRSTPSFEQNISLLLSTYRSLASHSPSSHKIIHVAHSSLDPTSPLHISKPGFKFQDFATPESHEEIVVKNVNSAFIGTGLEGVVREWFNGEGRGILYVVGLSTDHCVSTTVRMAANLGVCGKEGEVVVVQDGTAAWGKGGWDAENVHGVHVESLREFAGVKGTGGLVMEWEGWMGREGV